MPDGAAVLFSRRGLKERLFPPRIVRAAPSEEMGIRR